MDKMQLAAYLHHLHVLMAAIDPTPTWMAKEYQRHWGMYKEQVNKEHESAKDNR